MTDAQRRYMLALHRVRSTMISPAQELIDATTAVVDEFRLKAMAAQTTLEQMRPAWAQGYTDDSVAAQATAAALAELWGMLKVDNQTAAVQRLERLGASIRLLDEQEPK